MRKDLNYLNTNCRVYDMHFTETEFMNQTRDKLNTSRMRFQLFLMYLRSLEAPLVQNSTWRGKSNAYLYLSSLLYTIEMAFKYPSVNSPVYFSDLV